MKIKNFFFANFSIIKVLAVIILTSSLTFFIVKKSKAELVNADYSFESESGWCFPDTGEAVPGAGFFKCNEVKCVWVDNSLKSGSPQQCWIFVVRE